VLRPRSGVLRNLMSAAAERQWAGNGY
jgi:hypothetical protein